MREPGSTVLPSRPVRRPRSRWVLELGPVALAALLFVLYAVRAGLPGAGAARACLAVVLVQILPGALCWRAVRPRHGWAAEDVAMGFAVGTALGVGAQVAAGLSRQPLLAAAAPLAVAAVLLAVPLTRERVVRASWSALPWWWGGAVALVTLLAVQQLRDYLRVNPLTWAAGARTTHNDTYLHLSLAGELAHRGPVTFPWVASEPLGYHWFSHAWIAQVSTVSGTGLDEVLLRVMPALVPVLLVLAAATAALRLSGIAWTGPVCALLTLAGGDLNVLGEVTPGFPETPLSPGLGLGAPLLLGLVVLLALRWRGETPRGAVLLVPVLAFAAAGTKGSTLPLAVAGLALALAAMAVLGRAWLGRVAVDLLVVALALELAVKLVFRDSEAGLAVDLTAALRETAASSWFGHPRGAGATALVVVLTLIACLSRAAGLTCLLVSAERRRDPLTWVLVGAAAAGTGAVLAFSHPGASQGYFLRSAGPLMALGSTLGFASAAPALAGRLRWTVLTAVAGGAAVVLLPPWLLSTPGPLGVGRGLGMLAVACLLLLVALAAAVPLRRGGPLLPVGALALALVLCAGGVTVVVAGELTQVPPEAAAPVSLQVPLAVSRNQVDAARWVRDHSDVDDVVMTNRHCVVPVAPRRCDSRHFVVAAFSERQVLVEAWTATPTSARLAPRGRDSIVVDYWMPALLALNDGFVERPTADAARRLADLGVRWVYVDGTRPHAATLEPFARRRLHNPGVDVYELPGAGR